VSTSHCSGDDGLDPACTALGISVLAATSEMAAGSHAERGRCVRGLTFIRGVFGSGSPSWAVSLTAFAKGTSFENRA